MSDFVMDLDNSTSGESASPSMCIVKETLVQELKDVISGYNTEKLERRLPQTLGIPTQNSVSQTRYQPPKKKPTPKKKVVDANSNDQVISSSPIQTPISTTHSSETPDEVQIQHMPSLIAFSSSVDSDKNKTTFENHPVQSQSPPTQDDDEDALIADSIEDILEKESEEDLTTEKGTNKRKKKEKKKSKEQPSKKRSVTKSNKKS